jgi:ABC-type multidrug transport system ATPase subunit
MEYVRYVKGVADKKKIDEMLDFVGLHDVGRKKAGKFSLGMTQRLGIALALLTEPEIMVLDEPVNGLDPIGVVEIRRLIRDLNEKEQMTILISSHNLPELYQPATDFIIIDSGKVKKMISQEQLENEKKESLALQYLASGALPAPVQAYIKRKETAFLQAACAQDNVAMLERVLSLKKKHTLGMFEEYLAAAEGHTEATAYLIDFRNRLFTVEDVTHRADDLIEKDLGFKERTLADWKEIFKLSIADGSVRISGYKKNDTIVEIPETIDGHPVMKIGDGAFKDHGTIESILLPFSITEIGANAFRGCIKLESIVLPEAVESIGHSAFGECTSLKNIVLPQTIKYLRDKVFMGCAALKQVTLPEGLEWVLESLFDGCHSLETVRIPDTVKEILDYAFRDCKALQQVVMPAKLTTIGQGAFTNCKTLTELVLPDGVKEIDHYAFRGCTKLTKIRVPATAKSIRPDAFNGCKKLTIHAPVGCRGANLAKANKIPFVAE